MEVLSKPRQNPIVERNRKSKSLNIPEDELHSLLSRDDPIIVYDSHMSETDSDAPIGLTVRQPSFSSLHGVIVPKGATSLSDYTPILEEVEPLPVEPIQSNDDPNVVLVQELSSKNAERWSQLGYKPPDDLIPLVRAASAALLHQQTEFQKPKRTIPETIPEDDNINSITDQTQKSRKRSGSVGHMPGETINEIPLEVPQLFGHLPEIVEEEPGSMIYQILQTGEIPDQYDSHILRKRFRVYAGVCDEMGWEDELDYFNEIIDHLDDIDEDPQEEKEVQTDIFHYRMNTIAQLRSNALLSAKRTYLDQKAKLKEQNLPEFTPSSSLTQLQKRVNELKQNGKISAARALSIEADDKEQQERSAFTRKQEQTTQNKEKKLKEKYDRIRSDIEKHYDERRSQLLDYHQQNLEELDEKIAKTKSDNQKKVAQKSTTSNKKKKHNTTFMETGMLQLLPLRLADRSADLLFLQDI